MGPRTSQKLAHGRAALFAGPAGHKNDRFRILCVFCHIPVSQVRHSDAPVGAGKMHAFALPSAATPVSGGEVRKFRTLENRDLRLPRNIAQ
jgi:hypothetical protein